MSVPLIVLYAAYVDRYGGCDAADEALVVEKRFSHEYVELMRKEYEAVMV